MSKYVRGVSHSLHQEHGFSWRGVLLLQSWGFTSRQYQHEEAILCSELSLSVLDRLA